MIYGGQAANASARHRKQERREVCSVKVAAPVYLDWSDKPITFDQADHPDHVPSPGKYLLVVDPIIGDARLTKVLMDGGSSLNIIYTETLGLLRVDLSSVWAGAAPFHGIFPGKRVQPLGQLNLPVCFGTPSNFRRETLTFEVVGFRGTYHAVLGRPCYAKFMAVPNYTDQSNQVSREDSLDQLEEARDKALLHSARYQQSLRCYHARGIRSRDLQVGGLVLRLRQDARGRHKLTPPWEGPFIIAKVLKPETYKLANSQGGVYDNAWNIQQLRRFYP
jgi:hypothetical protein